MFWRMAGLLWLWMLNDSLMVDRLRWNFNVPDLWLWLGGISDFPWLLPGHLNISRLWLSHGCLIVRLRLNIARLLLDDISRSMVGGNVALIYISRLSSIGWCLEVLCMGHLWSAVLRLWQVILVICLLLSGSVGCNDCCNNERKSSFHGGSLC